MGFGGTSIPDEAEGLCLLAGGNGEGLGGELKTCKGNEQAVGRGVSRADHSTTSRFGVH